MSWDAGDTPVMDADPGDTQVYCHECEGEGKAMIDTDPSCQDGDCSCHRVIKTCPACDGNGWVYKSDYKGGFPATRWP